MNKQSLTPWTRRTPSAWSRENDPFMTLHSEMNRLFDDVFRGMSTGGNGLSRWPTVDLTDTGDQLRVTAELPGMSEKDIDVTLKDGILSLTGERKIEKEDEERQISERYFGRFARHIPLGDEIDEDNVTASFDNGELTITLPKTESAKTEGKRIDIKKSG